MKKNILRTVSLTVLTLGLAVTSAFAQTQLSSQLKNTLKNSILLHTNKSEAFVDGVETTMNDLDETVYPRIKDGRTLVPIRFIAESLGSKVDWNASKKLITIQSGKDTIKFAIDSKKININGVEKNIDVPAQIFGARTFIPLRALAESLGKEVFWDNRGIIVLSEEKNILNGKEELLKEIESVYKDPLENIFKLVDKNMIIRESDYGFYYTSNQITKLLGQPTSKSQEIEQGYGGTHQDWVYENRGIEIEMAKYDDSPYGSVYITLKSPFKYKTAEGIGIGSTKQDFIKAYGDLISDTFKDEDSIEIGDEHSSRRAFFKNNKITSIRVGNHPN